MRTILKKCKGKRRIKEKMKLKPIKILPSGLSNNIIQPIPEIEFFVGNTILSLIFSSKEIFR